MSNYASANENGKKKLLIKLFETCTTFFISSFQKHDPFTISIRSPGLPPDPQQVNQPILVCTAHIHWDPEFCDVKLIQTMMLSYELKGILEEASHSFRPGHKPDTNSVQLLLCGDFNSLPDSGVIEFLSSGRVSADHPDFKELQYKSVLQKISGCEKPNEFTHSFKLASAYSEDIMPFTNYT